MNNPDQALIERALAYIPKVRRWRIDYAEDMGGCEYIILPPNSEKLAFTAWLEFPELYVPGCLAFSGAVPPDVYYSEGTDPRRGSTHWRKIDMP